MSSWECSLIQRDDTSPLRFGLVDLFGRRRRVDREDVNRCGVNEEEPFFTFRMEHREGGAMAQHHGEERILVFRSDQHGAVAKIVYSSNPAMENSCIDGNIQPHHGENKTVKSEDEMLQYKAQAKVHVLSVKEPYRGFDLGGLLFLEAMASLKEKYMDADPAENTSPSHVQMNSAVSQSVRCQLDAEEDIRRHNKLVGFYERLGCSVKPRAKISYLNNNDGETYRKVPMQIALRPKPLAQHVCEEATPMDYCSLVDRQGGFLPVRIRESCGKRAKLSVEIEDSMSSTVDWLVVETDDGFLEFHTTNGCTLAVDPDGHCVAAARETTWPTDWSRFQLFRVSDAKERVLRGEEEDLDDDDGDSTPYEARQKELWIFQSVHGSFLNLNRDSCKLQCSKDPAFWQTDEHAFGITCTNDTPPRRQHFRRKWSKQTVQYVRDMKDRYCSFGLGQMTIKKALDLVRGVPGDPFSVEISPLRPSLRTVCVSVAESLLFV